MQYLSRITNSTLQDAVLQSLYTNRSALTSLQEQISTGKRIDTPSDDPIATFDVLSSNEELRKIDTYLNNIDYAISETTTTESVIQNSIDLIQRAKELTIQASNGTNSTTELQSINSEIEQIINSLKDVGNTKFGSKYIFGGLNTDNPPFTSPTTGEIQYNGTPYSASGDYKRYVEVAESIKIEINLAGDDVFGYYQTNAAPPPAMVGTGLFNTLSTLSEELQNNPADYDAIRSKIDDLDNDLNHVIDTQAKIGGIATRLEMTKSKLENDQINYTKMKSNAEDIDLAKAISDLTFQENALQVSLSVSSKVIQASLLNYM